jgi:hypothetical protein
MKKFIIPITVFSALSFASCKKDLTCYCSYRTTTNSTIEQEISLKETRKKAEEICATYETPVAGTFWKCVVLD